jgi:hypothetical protein
MRGEVFPERIALSHKKRKGIKSSTANLKSAELYMSLHVNEAKLSPIARQLVEADAVFADFLKTAIENKDLKQTLTLCAKKAKQNQITYSLSEMETAELAYELFLVIFEPTTAPENVKMKMAEMVLAKLRSAVSGAIPAQTPQNPPVAPSPIESPAATPISGGFQNKEVTLQPMGKSGPKLFGSAPMNSEPSNSSPSATISSAIPPIPAPSRPKLFSSTPAPESSFEKPIEAPISETHNTDPSLIAQKAVMQDTGFEMELKTVIQGKKLQETLNLCINKAQTLANEQNLPETIISDLANALFLVVFNDMPINPDQKQKMADTIKRKIGELVNPPPMNNTAPIEKTVSIQKPTQADIQQWAAMVIKQDPSFNSQVRVAIENRKLKDTMELLGNRSKEALNTGKFPGISAADIAVALFSEIFADIPIEPTTKKTMASTIEVKIREAFGAIVAPMASNIVQSSSQAGRPQFFNTVFTETQTTTPSTSTSGTQTEEDRLKQEREAIRSQRQAAKTEEKNIKPAPTGLVINPLDKVQQWLRSDNKFIENVANIKQTADNAIRINLDPESEGFIAYIDLKWIAERIGDYNIIKIEASTNAGKKYPMNVVVVDSGRKMVAMSIDEENIPEDQILIQKSKEINFKNQLEWDQLMTILNNDKDLLRNIDDLELKNPAHGIKEQIFVPVIIKRDVPGVKIIVRTFLTLKVKPKMLFLDIMEKIAEDLDQISGDEIMSISSRFSQIESMAKKDYSGYQFRYLEKDSQVTFKSCQYCGRPFPNPDADYRRCPHCLAKLK